MSEREKELREQWAECVEANNLRSRGVINALADELARYTGTTVPQVIRQAEALVDANEKGK